MEHYAGLDVSLELTSVCIVDARGEIVREVKVASEPEALIGLCGMTRWRSFASGSKQGRCRSGSTRDWLPPASTQCCSRRGM